jgi:hypothetical protein
MKKTTKRFDVSKLLITALIALLVFSTISCPDPGSGGNGTGNTNTNNNSTSAFLGSRLSLSGQVYLEKWNEDETSVRYSNFNDNLAIIGENGGSGSITMGNLSYSIGAPTRIQTLYFEDVFDYYFDNFTSTGSVRGYGFDTLPTDNRNYSSLYRDNTTAVLRSNSYSETYEQVIYIYVDNDVTLRGTGWKEGPITETEREDGITYTYDYTVTLGNLNVELKTGWNALYTKEVMTITSTGRTSANITETLNISMSNPSNLKWTLMDRNNPYYSLRLNKSDVFKTGKLPLESLRQMKLNLLP